MAVPDIWKEYIPGGLKALAQLPWIMDPSDNPVQLLIDPFFSSRNVKPSTQLEVDGDEVIRVLVAAGKGVSFLRKSEVEATNRIGQEVHAIPFEGLAIDLNFVCLQRRDQDPVMQAVIDHVTKVWKL